MAGRRLALLGFSGRSASRREFHRLGAGVEAWADVQFLAVDVDVSPR